MNTAFDRANDTEFITAGTSTGVEDMPSSVLTPKSGENKPFSLKVSQLPFESTTESKLLTTLDLGTMISSIFKKVFKDFDGCQLVLDQAQNRWKASLYFCENVNARTEGAVTNIIRTSSKADATAGKTGMTTRLENVAQINRNVHYRLTEETTDVLTKYYMHFEKKKKDKKDKTGKVDFTNFTQEQTDTTQYGYGNTVIYVVVNGVDVVEILKDIYGSKNEEDHWVDYSVTAIRPVTQFQPTTPNLLMSIQRIDCEIVKDLYAKIAGVPSYGRLSIIR